MSQVKDKQLTIYTTGFCGYCHSAKRFFDEHQLDYEEIAIDKERGAREQMVQLAGRTSVPQIFVGERHIGGFDDMIALHREGGFLPLFEAEASS